MNRREYLRSLAIGSAGLSVSPFSVLENKAEIQTGSDVTAGDINGVEIGVKQLVEADKIYLVADTGFIGVMQAVLPSNYIAISIEELREDELIDSLVAGNALVWLTSPERLPPALSIGAHVVCDDPIESSVKYDSPIEWPVSSMGQANVMGAYIAPPKGMPYHNVDEEVRADFLPILEAKDRFGQVVGYPAVYMNYYAPSLALGRFEGCECFLFFTKEPFQLLDEEQWLTVLKKIERKRRSCLQITDFNTNYSAYYQTERVQLRVRLRNRSQRAVSAMLRFWVRYAGKADFTLLGTLRRVPAGGSSTEAIFDFLPQYLPGLCEIRMEVLQDAEKAELLAVDGELEIQEIRHLAFVIADNEVKTTVNHDVKGLNIKIENQDAFWVGTHYYPSTSWWEWVWRDYRPLKAQEDFAAIRKAGYRVVRVWINPVLDEQVLRSVDVAIRQASENGIVVILTLFTQWIRQMGFPRETGEQVLFDFRHPRDFNLISISLRNLDRQREFVSILANRWKHAGNLIYNLANEVYIKDPDASQMDGEVRQWEEAAMKPGTLRDSLLFKRWANVMTATVRSCGANQLVLPGYMFSTMDGGDVNVGNADAPVICWHSYYPPEHAGLKLHYFDPVSSNKPILLEEFGYGEWNPLERYDGIVHYALAAGAAGAVSYEWGVSWLSKESCFWPLPLREILVDDPDPRWFSPFAEMAKLMSEKGVGMCPTPSGTGYGSIYHGTPFPASAAVALGRIGLFGEGLERVHAEETTYVIVPQAALQAIDTMDGVFGALWRENVLFGVWQENELSTLPSSARTLICPYPLSDAANEKVDTLNASGRITVFTDDSWKASRLVDRVATVAPPNEKIDVISRRTTSGVLLTIITEKPQDQIKVAYQRSSVQLGVCDFGMVHVTPTGVRLVEGTKAILINNEPLCRIDAGRIIIATSEPELKRAREVKLMLTKPTQVVFGRKIGSISISDGFGGRQPVDGGFRGATLHLDDQLVRYVIYVSFID